MKHLVHCCLQMKTSGAVLDLSGGWGFNPPSGASQPPFKFSVTPTCLFKNTLLTPLWPPSSFTTNRVLIGGMPSMQSRYSAKIKRYGICMEERGVHCIKVHRSKSEDTLCRLLITIAEENYDTKVLSKPWKADNESEERKCWGREFQSASTAKEKDLRSIPNRISGTMMRILFEHLRELGGTYKVQSNKKICWLLELQDFESKCGNLKFNTGRNRQPIRLGGRGKASVL